MTAKQTIYDLVQSQSRLRPNSDFLLSPDKRDHLNFAGLGNLVFEFGHLLRRMGVSPSDRVVTALPNGPESASVFLATAASAACAPLNPNYSADQFAFYIDDLEPAAVLLPEGSESPLRKIATSAAIPVIEIRQTDTAGRFEANAVGFRRDQSPSTLGSLDDPPGSSDTALLLHTSGTTARPKLVPISHSNLLASAGNIAATLALTESDRALNIMPLFHIHGLVGVLLSSLTAGAQVVCTPGMDPEKFPGWLRQIQPTWYSGVPTMHSAVLSSVAGAVGDGSIPGKELRFIRSSSASLPVSTLHQLESTFGVPVVEAYGMTEAAHQMASNPLPPLASKPGSVGLPSGPDISIRGENGQLCAVGEVGEVLVRGETIISAYEHGRSAESFVDGWFKTGDLGYLDEDGYLFLTGRIKEMVNRGGEKVAPAAVESVLIEHPAVSEAVVFGAPHDTLGEDVVAALVLADMVAQTPTLGELRAWALSRLSAAEVPGQFVFVPEIPKGPTGKVQRSRMFDRLGDRLRATYQKPSGRIAEMLVKIWSEVLDAASIGANDNFFALGGDSLSGARVTARVRHVFQIEFDIVDLFVDPVLEGMASRIEQALIEKIRHD
ncbi:MAG: non-ribosomal peptide synthetase [Rhodothermia bacterium]